jgi:hypothetical protein
MPTQHNMEHSTAQDAEHHGMAQHTMAAHDRAGFEARGASGAAWMILADGYKAQIQQDRQAAEHSRWDGADGAAWCSMALKSTAGICF